MKNTGEFPFYFYLVSLGNSFIYNTCLLRILVQDPFLIFVNNPKQPLHARNSFKDILKKDYQKVFKKLTELLNSCAKL